MHHEDVPDATSFQQDGSNPLASNSLAHIATTLITLKSSESIRQDQEDLRKGVVAAREFCYLTAHANAWESAVCEIEHKRKSGKVAREVTLWKFTNLLTKNRTLEAKLFFFFSLARQMHIIWGHPQAVWLLSTYGTLLAICLILTNWTLRNRKR